jgi:signal transduction histidine kinase
MGAPLAWRRVHPGLVATAVVVAALGHAVVIDAVPPFALWFALFAVVVHTGPTRRVATGGALTALGTVAAVALGPAVHDGRGAGGVLATLLLTAVVALAAALVRTERARHDALRQRAASLERERDAAAREAAAEERLRIARDLHDLVGHGLSSLAVQSSTARLLLDSGDTDAARERLRSVEATTRTALREMRQLLGVLRDDARLDPSPGATDLLPLVQAARDDGLDVELSLCDVADLPADVGLVAYRVVQESLTNVRRHAPGAAVTVHVTRHDEAVEVSVTDSGGSVPSAASPGGGHGLLGLRERVVALGGDVTTGPSGSGWRVSAVLPLTGGPA